MKRTYRVTIKNLYGYKEFTNKHELRLWLMNFLEKEGKIEKMNIDIL